MLFGSHFHYGPDRTPGIDIGLGVFFVLVALANFAYAYLKKGANVTWYVVGVLLLVAGGFYFAHQGPVLPGALRDTLDYGIKRGLTTIGQGATGGSIASVLSILQYASIVLLAADALLAFAMKNKDADSALKLLFVGADSPKRMTISLFIASILGVVIYGLGPVNYFLLSLSGFSAFVLWRTFYTRPDVAWTILVLSLVLGGLGMTDYDFRQIIVKPDNVPIVGLVYLVGFFTWLSFYKAVENDERIASGKPLIEQEEAEKILVWPDLVYTELICMVVVTVVLVLWSTLLPAPIEQPASSTATPNPSKAPWYFLGLQEMLVYYDPWLAGVVLPTMILVGLIAVPYIDYNQKGNGYYTFNERPFAIVMYLFGFIVLWVTLIILGTFLRGPNWNFFGLFENWTKVKLEPLNNVDLSEYFWVWTLRQALPQNILLRELPGFILVILYFVATPPLLAKTIFRDMFIRMGFLRFMVLMNLFQFMAALPIKMVLRWCFNLKYIVGIPEYFFNI